MSSEPNEPVPAPNGPAPADEFRLIPLWRVQGALRDYADRMEAGLTLPLSAPDALRQAALVMERVA